MSHATIRALSMYSEAAWALAQSFAAKATKRMSHEETHAAPMPQATQATCHMVIINPLKGAGKTLQSLFSTHPDTQERIARLRQQAALMRV